MSGEGIVLHACGLASKYGFCDGDILSEIILDKLGYEQWTNARQSEILVDLVRERLLPLLPGVEVYEIITCHNPIRAKDEWASFCRDSSVSVEIPVEDILRRAALKREQNAQNEHQTRPILTDNALQTDPVIRRLYVKREEKSEDTGVTYSYEAALYAERNRNQAYKAIIAALEDAAEKDMVTRKIIAERIGRKAPQVSKWLSGPSNWTLDTISDLLFSIGATVDYNVVKNSDRPGGCLPVSIKPQAENFFPQLVDWKSSCEKPTSHSHP